MSDTARPLVPREILFGNPEREMPALSPDGSQLAWLAPDDGVMNVWVAPADVDDPAGHARVLTADRERGIHVVVWAYDGRHVLYVQDTGGDEDWHLHAVDVETGEDRDLTPFDGVQARVVGMEPAHPDVLLVGLNDRQPELHDVHRLHLPTGQLTLEVENPGFIGFVADAELQVRAALAPLPDGGIVIHVRDTVDDDWRVLLQVGQEDSLGTTPIAFDADGTHLLVLSSQGANASRLLRYDLASGDHEVVYADDRFDVTDVQLHPDTREVLWVSVLRDRISHQPLDPAYADDLGELDAALHGDVALFSHDEAFGAWLVLEQPDDGPNRYHRYERATRTLTPLLSARPALERFELARTRPFRLTARDGLELHGYVTLPVDAREGVPQPTVLLVHGGPWHRDTWTYDPEVAWLADRGYAVLRVNFRGSTGYGKDVLNAGDKQWGAAMHHDLLDAVDWAVEQGIADPDRVGIYGGSYGGYAALVGATFTPDRFACAIDLVGPSNLITLIESVPPYWAPMIAQFHQRVGDPASERDLLWERSPLSRADEVSIPLLIAQGANDPRVKQAESEQIVAALVERGIPHEYLLYPDEGHGFVKPENRLSFHAAAEAFLAEHLGGRHEVG